MLGDSFAPAGVTSAQVPAQPQCRCNRKRKGAPSRPEFLGSLEEVAGGSKAPIQTPISLIGDTEFEYLQ
jgi:hypothetical protein